MRSTLRTALRGAGWSIGGLMLLLVTFAGLLAFPGFMFAHEVRYANISAYTDEDRSTELTAELRAIHERIAASAIDAPGTRHRIFFGHGKPVFGFLQDVRWQFIHATVGLEPSLTYNASWPPRLSHVITFRTPDFEHGRLVSERWPTAQDAAYVLTHEVAHSLVLERLGMGRAAALPLWKAEGYPDYVAATAIRRRDGYSLRASMTRALQANLAPLRDAHGDLQPLTYRCIGQSYLRIETGDYWNTCYYLSRLLVEYQLDVKGLTFDALVDPAVSDLETWQELLTAYEAGEL